jgi:hypothetical protein
VISRGTSAASQREIGASGNISQHKTKIGPVPIWISLRLVLLSIQPRWAIKSVFFF